MQRSIRVRLMATLAALVVGLAGLGGWSALRLRDLGRVAERILADNYLSVEAAQVMRVSLERLDAHRRTPDGATPGDTDSGRAEDRRRFDEAFAAAAGNITEPGETDVIEAIRASYARYGAGEPGALETLRSATERLEALNADAMRNKSDAAGALARRDVVWTVALVALLTVAGGWLTRAVATSVIGPIETLTRATARIAAGDLNVEVPVARVAREEAVRDEPGHAEADREDREEHDVELDDELHRAPILAPSGPLGKGRGGCAARSHGEVTWIRRRASAPDLTRKTRARSSGAAGIVMASEHPTSAHWNVSLESWSGERISGECSAESMTFTSISPSPPSTCVTAALAA